MNYKLKSYLLAVSITVGTLITMQNNVYAKVTNRIEGKDRFKTSIAISKEGWQKSDYAIIANGMDFPDALSASPLATKYNAPIILVNGKELTTEIRDELARLEIKEAFIVGGTGAVSENIENSITNMDIKVERYWGNNRYETAVAVAKNLGDFEEVVIANGMGFADALSIAPIAAKKGMPILLTSKDTLDKSVSSFLNEKLSGDSSKVKAYIIGGPTLVSENIEKGFSNKERLYGPSRYETNAAILAKFDKDINFENIYIASGQDFPDALSGSALAAKNSAPIVLSNKVMSFEGEKFINSKMESIVNINIIGGKAITSEGILQDLNFSNVAGNSKGNSQNLGVALKSGEWIYHKDNINGYIFKSSSDGSKITQINSEDSYFLNVVGQWIYYTDMEGNIYKVSIDGKDRQSVNGLKGDYIEIEGNYIYYLTTSEQGEKLNRADLEGNNNEFIGDINSLNVAIKGDWAYYSDDLNGGIYKLNVNNKGNATKISEDAVSFMILEGDSIYYLNDEGILNKIGLDGNDSKVLSNNPMYGFNIQGSNIYYSNGNDAGKLYKMNLDGSEDIKLVNESSTLINIAGGWIYYINGELQFVRVRIDGTVRQLIK